MFSEDIVKCEEVLLHSDKVKRFGSVGVGRWCLCTPSHNCRLSLFCVRFSDCVLVCETRYGIVWVAS